MMISCWVSNRSIIFQDMIIHLIHDVNDTGIIIYIDKIGFYAKAVKNLIQFVKGILQRLAYNALLRSILNFI
jgi:hypothetical protein